MAKTRRTFRDPHYNSPTYLAMRDRVAANLVQIRIQRDFTQEAVAALCGMKTQQYQRIEWARVNLTFVTLARIADALGLDPVDLLAKKRRRART